MHFPTGIAAILAVASTAIAAFESTSYNNFDSATDRTPLQARNGGIWVGGNRNPSTYCPGAAVSTCGDFKNVTAFLVSNGRASMSTAVPGGQQLYIGPKGSLRYTIAHSGFIPDGSYTTGFRRYAMGEKQLFWTFDGARGASGFFACPQERDAAGYVAYKVYADVEGFVETGCSAFSASRNFFGGAAAWQYE